MKIALFDIDYTLIPFDSFLKYLRFIKENAPSGRPIFHKLIKSVILYMTGRINLTRFKEMWLIYLYGIDSSRLSELSRDFIEKIIIPSIKPGVMKTIENHRAAGMKIVLATASFEFYFRYLAEFLKTDVFVGTKARYDGAEWKIIGKNCKGYEKIERLNNHIDFGLIETDGSVGYTDSLSDLPFLNIVDELHIVDKHRWATKKIIRSNSSRPIPHKN